MQCGWLRWYLSPSQGRAGKLRIFTALIVALCRLRVRSRTPLVARVWFQESLFFCSLFVVVLTRRGISAVALLCLSDDDAGGTACKSFAWPCSPTLVPVDSSGLEGRVRVTRPALRPMASLLSSWLALVADMCSLLEVAVAADDRARTPSRRFRARFP